MSLRELVNRYAVLATERQFRLAEVVGDRPWRLTLNDGRLGFGDDLAWSVQILGTESYKDGTWLWSWANDASPLPAGLLDAAERLRRIGDRDGVRELRERGLPLEAASGYTLATVAAGLLAAAAYYRAPYDDGAVYVLITDPAFPREGEPSTTRMIEAVRKAVQSFDVDHVAALTTYAEQRGGGVARDGGALTVRIAGRPRFAARLEAGHITRLESL